MSNPLRCALLIGSLWVAACAGRPLPKYERPIARTQIQSVRTTAYTHSEADHIKHGKSTACGTTLACGRINSAAADWSRWPAGTIFRIQETGEVYRVDDYGWALAGTNTIDLYKPSRSAMNAWGVRRVTIQNLQWGDPHRSLAILKGRSKYKHVRRMLDGFNRSMDFPVLVEETPAMPEPPVRVAEAVVPVRVAQSVPVARAVAVGQSASKPFNSEVRR